MILCRKILNTAEVLVIMLCSVLEIKLCFSEIFLHSLFYIYAKNKTHDRIITMQLEMGMHHLLHF